MEINLFHIKPKLTRLNKSTFPKEKFLQKLFEENLETLLGVRFLRTQYKTTDNQKMDTLGIDENNNPVIIEYKCTSNVGVIIQAISYLAWLKEHRAAFKDLVRDKLGKDIANKIEWGTPRLICIAADFSKREKNAAGLLAEEMNGSVELVRYCKFGDNSLLLELLTKVSKRHSSISLPPPIINAVGKKQITVSESLEYATPELKNLYYAVENFIMNLGDDINKEIRQTYFAFRRIRNFACIEIKHKAKKIILYLKINPDSLKLEEGFTRNVGRNHAGTGELGVTLKSNDDLEKAKKLIQKSYEES